jgi:diacylglycerol kinase (ATP)
MTTTQNTKRSTRLIFNPAAGKGSASQRLPDIKNALSAAGIEPEVLATTAPGDAMALAEKAAREGVDLVLSVGGDGTLQEVANGFIRAEVGDAVPTLGIIPAGTGNDFLKTLGVPSDWKGACERVVRGTVRTVDVGRLNGRVFVNNVGIGFDAQVGIEAKKIQNLRGTMVYVAALGRTMMISYRTPQVTIQCDDQTFNQTVTLISIGNGRASGGTFLLTPNALLDDGQLDVCIIRGLSKPGILGLVPRVMKGTHITDPATQSLRARKITVTSEEPLPVHADGEVLYTDVKRIEVETLAGRLKVIA